MRTAVPASYGSPAISTMSSFRILSTCNRCRLRKHRCDQHLPTCENCKKAGTTCVGYDPVTKREVPRSYVFNLEQRVAYLESLLDNNDIEYLPHSLSGENSGAPAMIEEHATVSGPAADDAHVSVSDPQERRENSDIFMSFMDEIGSVPVQATSDTRFLGSTSGISFARVALRVMHNSDEDSIKPIGWAIKRRSFFGLAEQPLTQAAPLPDQGVGRQLVESYFKHSNMMYPILEYNRFMETFNRVYSHNNGPNRSKDLYFLNMVFAIGAAGCLPEDNRCEPASRGEPRRKRQRMQGTHECDPEEYYSTAKIHFQTCLDVSRSAWHSNGLTQLQAILLLAAYALFRPAAPGLWYIVGAAMRLAVDIGLHQDHSRRENCGRPEDTLAGKGGQRSTEANRLQNLQRNLWWCTYSFDRLVSMCVGRPVTMSDDIITTNFPRQTDESHSIFSNSTTKIEGSAHTIVANQYFRLRILQSEISQTLQSRQAQKMRAEAEDQEYYLQNRNILPIQPANDSLNTWRMEMNQRLQAWKDSIPSKEASEAGFPSEYLELNYWQTSIVLNREPLQHSTTESFVDIDQHALLRVAEASKQILRIYRYLHLKRLVNYTFLDTHQLFMAGVSMLYSAWHSSSVRRALTIDEIDSTILGAMSVLEDLTPKCPPARACRDVLQKISKMTIRKYLSSSGVDSESEIEQDNSDLRETSATRGHFNNGEQFRTSPGTITVALGENDLVPNTTLNSPPTALSGAEEVSRTQINVESFPTNSSTPLRTTTDDHGEDYEIEWDDLFMGFDSDNDLDLFGSLFFNG